MPFHSGFNEMITRTTKKSGFTLIELSIVLVIIGLIVGGILVGQDLIRAAAIRAQISQIEKYNAAVNTFRSKYNAIPGDMIPSTAAALGFFTRSGATGDGDGSGIVSGSLCGVYPQHTTADTVGGETVLFWTDLSAAGLIDAGLNDSSDTCMTVTTDAAFAAELPRAKIGNGNFVYVNGVYSDQYGNSTNNNGFQIFRLKDIGTFGVGLADINAGITPLEAYNIDQKIDDGRPLSGKVLAMIPDSTGSQSPGLVILTTGLTLCVTGAVPYTYNVGTPGASTVANCSLRFNGMW